MTTEELTYRQRERERPTVVKEAREATKEEKKEAEMERHLTPVEKVVFGIAATFAAGVLVICLSLTIIGFIFSPITDTLIFALLMGATGTASYAIWRGGRARYR